MVGKNVVGSGKEAILDLFFKFDKSVQLICVSFKRGNGPRKLSFKWNSPHQGYINSEVTKGSTSRGHQGFPRFGNKGRVSIRAKKRLTSIDERSCVRSSPGDRLPRSKLLIAAGNLRFFLLSAMARHCRRSSTLPFLCPSNYGVTCLDLGIIRTRCERVVPSYTLVVRTYTRSPWRTGVKNCFRWVALLPFRKGGG